jgi:dsRNA-specific ribonuclease
MKKDRNHLFELLGLKKRNKNKLVQSLTHSSFNKKDEVKNNSRFVFLGMFGLRGTVARLIYDYAFGTGQQLQHLLGNTFSLAKQEKLFDSWDLSEYIRIGTDFDHTKPKHIFVYALFGLLE